MSGFLDGAPTAGNVRMMPLSENEVRFNAGTAAFQPNLSTINKNSIVVEVLDDNSVKIRPYKDIEVVQLDNDPNFPNTFEREEDRFGRVFNNFLLCYEFTIGGVTRKMQEELRMEVLQN